MENPGTSSLFSISDDPGRVPFGASHSEESFPFRPRALPRRPSANPKPPPSDTQPPAHPHARAPRRTATRRLSSPDARTRRLDRRRNVGRPPANSVPPYPPPTPQGRPACPSCILGLASHHRSPLAGCVYAVGQDVDSGRHALFRLSLHPALHFSDYAAKRAQSCPAVIPDRHWSSDQSRRLRGCSA
jgi:hypothetical protein